MPISSDIIARLGAAAGPVVHILEDPNLPKVIKVINDLHKIEQKRPSTRKRTAAGKVPGIGLGKMVAPMGAFVFLRKNPVVGWLVIAMVVAVPVLVGYSLGRRSK